MGGCATKPKVLKGEEDLTPEPAPNSSESAAVATKEGSEAKEGVHTEEATNGITHEEAGDKIQARNEKVKVKVEEESGDVVKVDDGGSKSRSLGNLFKEGEREKESSGNVNETTQPVNLPLESVKQEENPNVETTTATTAPPTAALESSTATADVQTGKTDNQSKQQEGSSGIGDTAQKTEVTNTTAAPPVGLASNPSADELESTTVFEDAASEEIPITAADVVQTGNAENYEKEVERVAADAKDVNVTDKAERSDQIQDNTVLTGGSSAPAEVTGSK